MLFGKLIRRCSRLPFCKTARPGTEVSRAEFYDFPVDIMALRYVLPDRFNALLTLLGLYGGSRCFMRSFARAPRVKAKFHYAILVAHRSETGRRPAASWNLAYHLAR